MKTINRHCNNTNAAAGACASMGRRQLLFLGMALAGFAVGRRVLNLPPPRTAGQTFSGGKLSRHVAAFYSRHATGD